MNRRSLLRSSSVVITGLAGCVESLGSSSENDTTVESGSDCNALPSEYLHLRIRNHTDSIVEINTTVKREDGDSLFEDNSQLEPINSEGDFKQFEMSISDPGTYSVEASTNQLSVTEDWDLQNSCDSIGIDVLDTDINIRKFGKE